VTTLGRALSTREQGVLRQSHARFASHFQADLNAAILLLGVGSSEVDARFDTAELAAWTMVASQFFNLDEFVTK